MIFSKKKFPINERLTQSQIISLEGYSELPSYELGPTPKITQYHKALQELEDKVEKLLEDIETKNLSIADIKEYFEND